MAMIMQQIAHVISDQPLDKRTIAGLEHGLKHVETSKNYFKYLAVHGSNLGVKPKHVEERAKYSSSVQRVIEKRIHETKTLHKQRLLRLEQIKQDIKEKELKQEEEAKIKREQEMEREARIENERRLLMEQVQMDNERSKQEDDKKRSKSRGKTSDSDSEPEDAATTR